MPAVQNWLTDPFGTIEKIFASDGNDTNFERRVLDFFSENLADQSAKQMIPYLDEVDLSQLRNNQLVGFRCMIQDMLEPEYYIRKFNIKDMRNGQVKTKFSSFNESLCEPFEELQDDSLVSAGSNNKERKCFYCISIPARSNWTKQERFRSTKSTILNTTEDPPNQNDHSKGEKRKIDDRHHEMEITEDTATASSCDNMQMPSVDNVDSGVNGSEVTLTSDDVEMAEATSDDAHPVQEAKKLKGEGKTSVPKGQKGEIFSENDYYPITSSDNKCCLVKIYEDSDEGLSLCCNDIIEVVGILAIDPMLGSSIAKSNSDDAGQSDIVIFSEEQTVRDPPSSLVPRLHALRIVKLGHVNPLLPSVDQIVVDSDVVQRGRSIILKTLTEALHGDELAAGFVLCHLLSSVYMRRDLLSLGKFSLNLSGIKRDSPVIQRLYGFVSDIVTNYHNMSLTLDNFNKLTFVPKKDYKLNKLKSGLLQLPNNTQLILDETALVEGQLDSNGINNISALNNMIKFQKVNYDFQYNSIEFETNIQLLILSEGKSMLSFDCHVPLVPKADQTLETDAQSNQLTDEELDCCRVYLTLIKEKVSYDLDERSQEMVQEDFVYMRQSQPSSTSSNGEKASVEDLHRLLVLARLISISKGCRTLSKDIWEEVKLMEKQRKDRLR